MNGTGAPVIPITETVFNRRTNAPPYNQSFKFSPVKDAEPIESEQHGKTFSHSE